MAALVDIDEYAAAIGRTLDEEEIEAIEFQLEAASADVRDYLGQTLDVVVDDIVTLHGSGTKALLLPELPVVAVTAVTLNDEAITTYTADLDNGVLFRVGWGAVWNVGFSNVTVTYDHGYTEIPFNIRRAVIELAKVGYHSAGRVPGISSEITGPFAITYSGTTNDAEVHDKILGTLARRQVRKVPTA